MHRHFTLWIALAMLLGTASGWWWHGHVTDPAALTRLAGYLSLVTDVFLRLIRMIIAPLVFSTLVAGIAHMGGTGRLGRIGARTLAWFLLASVVSLLLGIVLVTLLAPGAALGLPIPAGDAASGVEAARFSLKDFIGHLVPRSIAEAMAGNEILQIVVFAAFFGVALGALGERALALRALMEQVVQVMLRVTGYVMRLAPIAVFAAVTSTVATRGLAILWTYGRFIGGFYLALALLWLVLFGLGALVLRGRIAGLVPLLREPVLLAFSTASSEAAFPQTLEQLRRYGVSERIAGFVLPLGYSFNLDGSMMYCTFATLFIAQAYGISLGLGQQLSMLLMLMVTSKGMAGVPRASLVVIAATLAHFGIPEAGLLLILAVDQFLDMGRSATNVVGNSIATAVVAQWEGELAGPADPAAVSPA
jgi:Na+/H+-dicarboxylate symporter